MLKGRPYYYARWCQRVDGRPKIVKTTYLGPLDHIVQAVEGAQQPPVPQTATVASFGDVAALYDQAAQVGLVELIDTQIPKREQGLSVGQYLLLAAINRAACPTSKAQLAAWYPPDHSAPPHAGHDHPTLQPRVLERHGPGHRSGHRGDRTATLGPVGPTVCLEPAHLGL
jgi:hypothetical protein